MCDAPPYHLHCIEPDLESNSRLGVLVVHVSPSSRLSWPDTSLALLFLVVCVRVACTPVISTDYTETELESSSRHFLRFVHVSLSLLLSSTNISSLKHYTSRKVQSISETGLPPMSTIGNRCSGIVRCSIYFAEAVYRWTKTFVYQVTVSAMSVASRLTTRAV